MSWITRNKFLTGLYGFILVVLGGGGYLIYTAWDDEGNAEGQFQAKLVTLKELRQVKPYPNNGNWDLLKKEKDDFSAKVLKLKKAVYKMQFPVSDITPDQFQVLLKKKVDALLEKASDEKHRVQLFPRFYLGFDDYQATLPKEEAVGLLSRQLDTFQFICSTLIDAQVDSIDEFHRSVLPEETAVSTPAKGVKPAQPVASGKKDEITVNHADLTFRTTQKQLMKVLNLFSTNQKQFMVVRSIAITNDSQQAPTIAQTMPPPQAPMLPGDPSAGADGSQDVNAPEQKIKFVFGDEKLTVRMTIDILNFEGTPE